MTGVSLSLFCDRLTKENMPQINSPSRSIFSTLLLASVLLFTLITSGATADDPERATKATYEQPELPLPESNLTDPHLKIDKNNAADKDHLPLSPSNSDEEIVVTVTNYSAIKTLGSLLFVMTLFGCVAYWMRRGGTRSNQSLSGGAWEILGHGNLGAKNDVQLVRLGNRLLLIGYSPNAIQTLAEITDPDEVQSILSSCNTKPSSFSGGIPKKLFAAFSGRSEQAFDRMDQNTNPAYVGSKDV